jgi:hypothetical protein
MTGSNGTHQDPAVFAARSRVGVEQDNARARAIYQKAADAGDMSSANSSRANVRAAAARLMSAPEMSDAEQFVKSLITNGTSPMNR